MFNNPIRIAIIASQTPVCLAIIDMPGASHWIGIVLLAVYACLLAFIFLTMVMKLNDSKGRKP